MTSRESQRGSGAERARLAAMLLLTLRGTPTLYYGDELGIGRVAIAPEAMQDAWEKNEPGLGLSRDPSRTPFQWDDTRNAGFTNGRPWLPLDPNYRTCNVESLRNDATSILTLYRSLITIRRSHSALTACSRIRSPMNARTVASASLSASISGNRRRGYRGSMTFRARSSCYRPVSTDRARRLTSSCVPKRG